MCQQVYNCCNEQLQADEEIELESPSKELTGVNEVSFTEFAVERGYELEESFLVDHNTLRQLTKLASSGGGLIIDFDVMLLGERTFWDPAADTLTIKDVPPNLRDQLQRRTSGDNQSVLYFECQTRREHLIWSAKNNNTVIRHNLQVQRTPPEWSFLQLIQQLSANEVGVL